jgi:DNA-binding HxlR family transcriptional regulator
MIAMAYHRKRPALDPCPVETVLAIVSGKWKVRILYLLSLDDLAFGEIRKSVGDIRQQVLSSVLKDLIADGVARRAETSSPRESIYGLTARGRELVALLMPVAALGNSLLAESGAGWQPPQPQRKAQRRNSSAPNRPLPASVG